MVQDRKLEGLKTSILRTILARRVTLGIFAGVALVVKLTSNISYLNPLFYSPLIWFLLTFPFQYAITRANNRRAVDRVHAGFFVVEIIFITFFVHLMGGSEWVGVVFYLFTVIYANFFLPRIYGYSLTALVILLYSGLVFLEYAGVIPHRSLFVESSSPYQDLPYNLTTVLAGGVGLYVALAYTVRSFTDVYIRKNEVLTRREQQLTDLSKRLLSAQEEERRRIARQLHDQLSQSLAAIKLHLASVNDDLPNEQEQQIGKIVDEAIDQTRTLAYSLRPPVLDELGLVASLERMVEMVRAGTDLSVSLNADQGERLPGPVESLLFYVAQEALSNANKHSQAKNVEVVLKRKAGSVSLSISDDGAGFDASTVAGLGLQGLRERLDMAGGKFTIESSLGKGTKIVASITYDNSSNH